jgi:hypothetical protein
MYLDAFSILILDRDDWSASSAGGIIPEAAAFRVLSIREWMRLKSRPRPIRKEKDILLLPVQETQLLCLPA